MLHFIDFEVIQSGDWCCCIFNYELKKWFVIVNDSDLLSKYYDRYKNELFIGYNIRNYDQYIYKCLLLGLDPVKVNNKLIIEGLKGWQISKEFARINLNIFDAQFSKNYSLKQLEAFQGHDICESSVDFMTKRKLTKLELDDLVKYCKNDVLETVNIFFKKIEEFDAYISLIKTFNLSFDSFGKTKAQLSAKILDCNFVSRDDAFDIKYINVINITKYREAVEFFKNNRDYNSKLSLNIAGVPHRIAWGGLHGAKVKYHASVENGKYKILHVDVRSYYPSMMIIYHLLSRSVANFDYYVDIYNTRINLKAQGKKKEQGPYKIILNGTFGICKDKYNPAFDERMANSICINGQLLLIDLIEKLENVPTFELIQSNTDGLIVKVESQFYNALCAVCAEWEKRTQFNLDVDNIIEIWQKDVNNYVFIGEKNGKKIIERKGAYVKETNSLDNDMPIVNKALVDFMIYGRSVEDTVISSDNLIDFQKIVKTSSKYDSAWHNDRKLENKVNRVFASKYNSDSYIGKKKLDSGTIEKFANTPDKCFINNGDITDLKCPIRLDKNYYINLAKKRLLDFGLSQ